jgi:predicted phage replisome organizer
MISWIKLDINILDDAKIKIIRAHPDGNTIVVLWIGLLCLAMKSLRPGIIEISNALPYTLDDLSNLFNIDKKTIELGMVILQKYRMIDLLDNGSIEIINFSKHQKIEQIERNRELTRLRVANYRDKSKLVKCNALLTHNSVTVTLTDKDKDKDKDKESRRTFQVPSLQDISIYCQQRKNQINPQLFIDHYTANGWLVGKNKMKDWKAAVRTWEQRDNFKVPSKKETIPQAQTSPYVDCPRCGSEVLKDQFIEINGEKYCDKCPQVKDRAKKDFGELSKMVGKIGKSIPAIN